MHASQPDITLVCGLLADCTLHGVKCSHAYHMPMGRVTVECCQDRKLWLSDRRSRSLSNVAYVHGAQRKSRNPLRHSARCTTIETPSLLSLFCLQTFFCRKPDVIDTILRLRESEQESKMVQSMSSLYLSNVGITRSRQPGDT